MKHIVVYVALALLIGAGLLFSQSSQNPHGKLKWDCQDCHTSDSWSELKSPINFNHDETGFRLSGAHASAQCIGCHKTPQFNHVSTSCIDCHADQHLGQLGQSCDNCHTTRDWQSRRDLLDLHAQKGFALTGVHAVADCEACHQNHSRHEYAGTSMDCIGCHSEAYNSTADPNHVAAGFSTNCEQCHHAASGTWSNATYTHKNFQLTGAHRSLTCRTCHPTAFDGTSADCYSCHSADFLSTTDPNHPVSGFNHNCVICHNTTAFKPAQYNHDATGFPLTGKHRNVVCTDCHPTTYAGTPSDCWSCHQSDYQAVADPNHVLANFDHNCTTCHTTAGWKPANFDHNGTTFPLTGAHVSLACISCHATSYAGTPSTCYACHQSDYAGVTDPNHATNNFDHDCTKCHTTAAWSPSSFDHATTAFPLTGAHVTASCISCHATGYANTPSTCVSCHQSDYNGTTSPIHTAANFPTTCQNCHSTSAWTPSTWNHDAQYFPITSGAHATVWNSCATCHTDPNNYAVFTCIDCHTHSKTTTDSHHTSVGDYQYTSAACYDCHPRGRH